MLILVDHALESKMAAWAISFWRSHGTLCLILGFRVFKFPRSQKPEFSFLEMINQQVCIRWRVGHTQHNPIRAIRIEPVENVPTFTEDAFHRFDVEAILRFRP